MQVEMTSHAARVLFGRTALFAARDDSRPVLNAIHVEARAGGLVVASAADGFRMGQQEVVASVADAGSALLPLAVAEWLKPLCGPRSQGVVTLGVWDEAVTVSFREGSTHTTLNVPVVLGTPPNYAGLHYQWKQGEASGFIAFNARFLGDVEKAARIDPEYSGIVRFFHTLPSSPAYAVVQGEVGPFSALLMPMFVNVADIDEWFAAATSPFVPAKPKRKRKKAAA